MDESTIIGDTTCPQCRANGGDRTGNHLILYSNGNKYCNRCGYKEIAGCSGASKVNKKIAEGNIEHLPTLDWRGVDEDIIKSYGVHMDINEQNGEPDHIYFPVYSAETNERIGWKVRTTGEKSFETIGNLRGVPKQFFGQWLCREGGKLLIIVEGESDTLAAKQILTDHQKGFYSVVGLSFGANSADKIAKDNLSWLDSFESVIVVPDQDKPGRAAAETLASIIGFKKCKIATLTDAKDTAELLEQGRSSEWMKALSTAKTYTPRGIVEASNFKAEFFSRPPRQGIPFAPIFSELNEATKGVARGEVALYTGGTGCGKSQFCDENIVYWLNQGYRVGVLKMEHDIHTNIDNLLGTYMGVNIKLFPDAVTEEAKSDAYDELYVRNKGSLFLIDHAFEDTSDDGFFQKMRELAVVSDCDIIVVDHLHALLYSVEDAQGSEHSRTDTIMRTLAQTAKQYNIAIHVVAHPRKSGNSGKSAEEGGYISLDDIKGSSSVKQVPDIIITMQRDIRAESLEERNTVLFTLLKNRYLGILGVKEEIMFDVNTLRYTTPPQPEEF